MERLSERTNILFFTRTSCSTLTSYVSARYRRFLPRISATCLLFSSVVSITRLAVLLLPLSFALFGQCTYTPTQTAASPCPPTLSWRHVYSPTQSSSPPPLTSSPPSPSSSLASFPHSLSSVDSSSPYSVSRSEQVSFEPASSAGVLPPSVGPPLLSTRPGTTLATNNSEYLPAFSFVRQRLPHAAPEEGTKQHGPSGLSTELRLRSRNRRRVTFGAFLSAASPYRTEPPGGSTLVSSELPVTENSAVLRSHQFSRSGYTTGLGATRSHASIAQRASGGAAQHWHGAVVPGTAVEESTGSAATSSGISQVRLPPSGQGTRHGGGLSRQAAKPVTAGYSVATTEEGRVAQQDGTGKQARAWMGGRSSRRQSTSRRPSSSSRRACLAQNSFVSSVAVHQQKPSSGSAQGSAEAATASELRGQLQRHRRPGSSSRHCGLMSTSRVHAGKARLFGRGGAGGTLSPEEEEEEEDTDEDDEKEEDDEENEEDIDDEEDDEDEEYDPMTPKGPLDNNNYGEVWLPIQARPRRNRKNHAVRQLVKETVVKPSSLIYPLFVHDQEQSVAIESMPGQRRLSIADLVKEVGEAKSYGINAFMLFPSVESSLKTNMGEESFNMDGVIPRAIAAVKEKYPDVLLLADVALDPYSCHGQDGVVDETTGKVLNDVSVHQACKQAVALARAGADMICPSDMMDGRVSAIRESLDMEGWTDVSILAYSCKYASALYSPFRDALASHPPAGTDKRSYQMDFSNAREADREAELDAAEGADMLLVKPGLPYLDIVARVREKSRLPVAVYHVSGEYAMLKAAAERGWINEKAAVLEVVKCMRRAGADAIATYFAKDIARWLQQDKTPCCEPCY